MNTYVAVVAVTRLPQHCIPSRISFVSFPTPSLCNAWRQGYDPDKDVAVLKIDAPQEALRPITVGVSNTLKASKDSGGS